MPQHNHHPFYRPFKDSSLGFFIDPSADTKNLIALNIEKIDLYHQPLEHPIIAVTFFLIKVLIIIIGEFYCFKLFSRIKNVKSTINTFILVFILTQMIFHPILIFFDLTVNLIYPVHEVIGYWFCTLGWFFYKMAAKLVLDNSFYVSLTRYLFIIHDKKIASYGKEKVKRCILSLYVLIPLIGIIADGLDSSKLSRLSFINKCYGNDYKVFLIESSTLKVLKRKFWAFEVFEVDGIINTVFALVQRLLRIAKTSVYLITGFNITEGFFYYKTLSYINR